MINVRAYKDYFGGKSGNGTYQTIVNHIPPHRAKYSLYLGNCAVTRKIKEAEFNFLNDIDPVVMSAWGDLDLPANYTLLNECALQILKHLHTRNDIELTGGVPANERFIHLDPPYLKSTRKSQEDVYRFQVDQKHHEDLLGQVVAMTGHKIMLLHYPNPLYDEVLLKTNGWNHTDFYSIIRNGLALERIYYNYNLSDNLLHDYSYIGKDFRQREAWERQRLNLLKKLNDLPPLLKNSIISEISSH